MSLIRQVCPTASRLCKTAVCRQAPSTCNMALRANNVIARFDHSVAGKDARDGRAKKANTTFSPSTHVTVEDVSDNVVKSHLSRSILAEFPEAEKKARIELACAYRLFGYFGWNEAIFNHLTVGITEPDGSKSFLINPYGLRYDEITASSLLKINSKGDLLHPGVVGNLFGVNRAGFVIHGAIHDARGDSAYCIMHSHHTQATGIACTKDSFLADLSQTAELMGPIANHDFEGLVVDTKEQDSLAKDIGDKNILIFRNHGILTAGETVGAAWYRMFLLIRSAEIQATAQAIAKEAGGIIRPSEAATQRTFEAGKNFTGSSFGQLEYSAYMRLMDKVDSSYRL